MKLNPNSITAKLYRWFFVKEEMPNSLCPYARRIILMWLTIIPYTILSLPRILLQKEESVESCSDRFFVGAFIWFFLFCVLSALFSISIFWVRYPSNTFFGSIQEMGIILLG